jgi:Sec-independent protein translocase protein TatA
MSFFGLGGFEILLIAAIALFVLGPKRLLNGIRDGRKVYSDLKRQRDALQTLIVEAIDLEEIKKQVDAEGLKESVKSLEQELALDQVADDVKEVVEVVDSSVPRSWRLTGPPVDVDSEVRDRIPELDLSGASDDDSTEERESKPESDSSEGSDADADEVKS